LPALGLLGIGAGRAAWILLALMGIALAAGVVEFRAFFEEGKGELPPLLTALLLLALRLVPVLYAAGPPGAEPAFHAFLARRILECGGWPADLSPQAPGVPAGGFGPALSFLAASWAGASGGGIQALPGIFLLLVCLAQWACDVGLLALGTALAGPAAGSAAALLLGTASSFPQDAAGWGGAGNLLALAAGCLLLSLWIRGKGSRWEALFLGAAAGAAHPMVGGILFVAFAPALLLLRKGRARAAVLFLGAGIFLFSGMPVFLARGPGFSKTERARAAAWAAETGPRAGKNLSSALIAPARSLRKRIGGILTAAALLGLLLGAWPGRIGRRGAKLVLAASCTPWLLLTGLPARLLPPAGLFYPERTLLFLLPPVLMGLGWALEILERAWRKNGKGRFPAGFCALALSVWAAGAVERNYVGVYLGRALRESLPAPSDLSVLAWMGRNLPGDAVVLTRPDDGGLWVPALAGRRATCFHTVPPLFEETVEALRDARPGFLFLGAKRSLHLHREWTTCPEARSFPLERKRVLRRSGRTLLLQIRKRD